jgi:hypothetical protein
VLSDFFTKKGEHMSFYLFQIISSLAVLLLGKITVWVWPDYSPILKLKLDDLADYYFFASWIFASGYLIRSNIEQKKFQYFDELHSELKETKGELENEKYESKREMKSLKEKNERLKKIINSLEKVEEEFKEYKIQNRSAKEANLLALKNFL